MRTNSIGEFEELVLMSVAALGNEAYGYSVRELLTTEADRSSSLGAVHATLYRLEDKGYVESELGGATEQRGGRRKRLFRLTGSGAEVLQSSWAARQRIWNLLPKSLKNRLAT